MLMARGKSIVKGFRISEKEAELLSARGLGVRDEGKRLYKAVHF